MTALNLKTRPPHVLVVGNDDSVFDVSSPLYRKVYSYGEVLGGLAIICRTGKKGISSPIVCGPLSIYAVRTRNPLAFIFRSYFLGRGIISKSISDTWIVTADNPFEEGFAAWAIARFSRKPLQLQIHTDVFSPFYRMASWKEKIRYGLAKFLIPRADCIRVVSERIKRSLMSNVKCQMSNVFVLPIWTDTSKFLDAKIDSATEERFKNYDFRMISVGRLVDKEKNFGMLLDIMCDFITIAPKSILVLVGEGPDRERYELDIINKGLAKNVILTGWREDLPSFYKSFDALLFSSNYEGWGRTVIEAMASGLAVVMTDVGLAGEVVKNGENGIVVPVRGRKAFFEATKEMYKNEEKRNRLAEAGCSTVLRLFSANASKYRELYKKSLIKCLSL